MKKRMLLSLSLIIILLSGCSRYHKATHDGKLGSQPGAQGTNFNGASKIAFEHLRLLEVEHAELDLGYLNMTAKRKLKF